MRREAADKIKLTHYPTHQSVNKTVRRAISKPGFVAVPGSMSHTIAADVLRQRTQGALRFLFRMVPPSIIYRLAARRRSSGADSGRLAVVVERRSGRVRLRFSGSHEDDRTACLQRQAWALGVVERCGGKRATLREGGCLAEGQPACEYTVSWAEAARPAAAVIVGLVVAVGLLTASHTGTIPAAGWILLPIAAGVAQVVERRRAARGNLAAEAESGAGFRWLLDRALGASEEAAEAEAATHASPGSVSPVLEQDGDFWRITYDGTTVLLRHSRGLALLAHLVRCPGRDIHVRELDSITPSGGSAVARDAPAPDTGMLPLPGDAGETLDAQARAEYHRRVVDLREELDDAERRHDLGRAESLRAELELLVDELRAAVGSGGRVRRVSADVERARVSITRRIRSAITQISKHHPSLGAHLASTVTTGYYCAYLPGAAADPTPEPTPAAR